MKKTQYYITIKLTDQSLQVDPDQINTLSYTTQNILHSDSEYSKACTLENGDVLAISSVVGTQQSKIAKLNNEGKPIFSNVTLSRGYSPDAQLIQPKNSDFYFLAYHNKQNINGQEPKEKGITFKDKYIIINDFDRHNTNHLWCRYEPRRNDIDRQNSLYQKISVVALKNGKVIIAGINPVSAFGADTIADLNIYNPKTGYLGAGLSFNATSNLI